MPYSNVPEADWGKMDDCVDKVMAQGHSKESAIAICHTSIVGGKSLNTAILQYTDKNGLRMSDCVYACQSCLSTDIECIRQCESCANSQDETHQACIEACHHCSALCAACEQYCSGGASAAECVSMCERCAEACRVCTEACRACAAACPDCAADCNFCAQECELCQQACELNAGPDVVNDQDEDNETNQETAMMSIKADYPWDECIADQMKEYGSKEKAEKVCGMIRARYGKALVLKNGTPTIVLKSGFDMKSARKAIARHLKIDPIQRQIVNLSYIKALGVSRPEDYFHDVLAVKSTGLDSIKGYLTLWGSPTHLDIENEYFTKSTDFWDNVLAFPRPLTWNHGQDRGATFKSIDVVGQIESFGDDEVGRFYEATLQRSHQYRKAIDKLIGQRVIGTSSDSAPQYVIREKTGKSIWLKQWPLFAGALTDVPCEPRMIGNVEYFKNLGLNWEQLISNAEAARQALRGGDADLESAMRLHDVLKLSI